MRKVVALLSLVVFVFAASLASAALVTEWSVDVSAGFNTGSVQWNGSPSGSEIVTQPSLSWGNDLGSGLSGLDITNPVGPTTVFTDGAAVANMSLTHRNRPITGTTLHSVELDSILTLTPAAPPGAGLPPATITFLISYLETTNNLNPCPNGLPNGVGVNINGCADIFAIDKDALNFPFQYDTDGPGGDPALTYFISFFEITNGLNPLPLAASNAVGVPFPSLGFMTPELQDTTATFAALITSEPVSIPEPSTFLLLGAGLAGVGLLRRRMKK